MTPRRGGLRPLQRLAAGALLACALVPSSSVAAQGTNHWAAIDNLTRAVGGVDKADRLPPAQLQQLVAQLTQRAQAYLDLYEFQRVLVRDHARLLDSAAKAGAPAFTAAPYYLGRALQELGDQGATAAYARAATTAPTRLRALAREWSAATAATGKGWTRDYVEWRKGKAIGQTTCPADVMHCALFDAILRNDVAGIARQQMLLARQPVPDHIETRLRGTDSVTVEFSDPAVPYLLAAADYALVAKLAEGRKEFDALRGLALLRLGRAKEALAAFGDMASTPNGAVFAPYVGEAQFLAGDRAAAEKTWSAASGPAALIALDVRSTLVPVANDALRQFQAERGRGLDRTVGRLYLARALLRAGRIAEAEEVMAAERPISQGSRVSAVLPSVLAVVSHVEYRRGLQPNYNDRLSFARSDLADFAVVVPVVRTLLRPLQELTTSFLDAPKVVR